MAFAIRCEILNTVVNEKQQSASEVCVNRSLSTGQKPADLIENQESAAYSFVAVSKG
jgi:hypothetical protein